MISFGLAKNGTLIEINPVLAPKGCEAPVILVRCEALGGSRIEDLEEDSDYKLFFDTPCSPTGGAADNI